MPQARSMAQRPLLADLGGLLAAVVCIHALYLIFIDPAAAEAVRAASELGAAPPRTVAVMLKDAEQEVCLILGLWCLWLLAVRHQLFDQDAHLLEVDFLRVGELRSYGPAALRALDERLREAAKAMPGSLPVAAAQAALGALRLNGSLHEANEAAADVCGQRLEAMYARLAIVRYVLWAIPSVGFLGTVRGIGQALGQADAALAGDLAGMAGSLGVAFNSTFVALFVSLAVTLCAQALQGRDERRAADARQFASERLLAPLAELAERTDAAGTPPAEPA